MSKKRKIFLHVGLDDGSGEVVDHALHLHRERLHELGVQVGSESGQEMFRAAVEILRDHAAWGFRREEVEGAWTRLVRRGLKGRGTLVVSQPLLAAARPEQVALLVDALAGLQVHVVVTVRRPDARTIPGEAATDLGSVLDRWSTAVRKPHRLHVVVADDGPEATWAALGRVVGFGTHSLRLRDLPAPRVTGPTVAPASRAAVLDAIGHTWAELLAVTAHDVVGDPDRLVPDPAETTSDQAAARAAELALAEAMAEVDRLARRNAALEAQVAELERKRRRLKRRLTAVA